MYIAKKGKPKERNWISVNPRKNNAIKIMLNIKIIRDKRTGNICYVVTEMKMLIS